MKRILIHANVIQYEQASANWPLCTVYSTGSRRYVLSFV